MRLLIRSALLAAVGLSALPLVAAANSNALGETPEPIPGSEPSDLLGGMVWVIVSLAIVITLIVLVIKWLSNRSRAWGSNRSMRSLGGVALGQNSSMQVVEIADRIYVVGVGETITLLDKFEDPEQVAAVIAALAKQTEGSWNPKDVTALIRRWRSGKTEEKQPNDERWNESASFQQLLQNKLSQQSGRKEQLENLFNKQNTNERLMDDEK
ncbi:flagellar biosynthetic protein FliO [Paenibacillus sp. strain BS8-2]